MRNMIKQFRLQDTLNDMFDSGRGVYFWTLTTADVCDYSTIRLRWKRFRHWMGERFPDVHYVQNFEVHPNGHGWHIHLVCDVFIDCKRYLNLFRRFGFGRVNCKRCKSNISDYLVKHAFKTYRSELQKNNKRFRLVNVSRNCRSLSNYVVCGGNSSDTSYIMSSNLSYRDKMQLINTLNFGFREYGSCRHKKFTIDNISRLWDEFFFKKTSLTIQT